MKNILYSLLAIFILNNAAIAQLMTDEQHRTMMNTYSTTLNNILSTTCPEGMSIDQYKRRLITGEMPALLPSLQSDIMTAAAPLKTYGAQFAAAKGLSVPYNDDDYKYFYAAFAPSTNISGGRLVKSTTVAGITAMEMWESATASFTLADCGSSALITDNNSLYVLANTCYAKVAEGIVRTGIPGVLLMMNGFSDRLHHYSQLEQAGFAMSHDAAYSNSINSINTFNNQPKNQAIIDQLMTQETLTTSDLESLAVSLGFPNKAAMDNFQCGIKSKIGLLQDNYLNSTMINSRKDKLVVLNSSIRYYPDQTVITYSKFSPNLLVALKLGNCSGSTPPAIVDMGLTWKETKDCILEEVYGGVIGLLPGGPALKEFLGVIENGITVGTITTALTYLCPECGGFYIGVSLAACLMQGLGN